MDGPTNSEAPSWTKALTSSSWKDQSLRSKLGATKNGCGVSAFAAPWRSQSRNSGLLNGCWQTKATDLGPASRYGFALGHPARRGGRASHALVDQGQPFQHDPRSVRGQRERGQFLREAMEPIQSSLASPPSQKTSRSPDSWRSVWDCGPLRFRHKPSTEDHATTLNGLTRASEVRQADATTGSGRRWGHRGLGSEAGPPVREARMTCGPCAGSDQEGSRGLAPTRH